ncbi:DNA ligase D [Chitinolyticbacter meiyuanensis]|uniref:DNA ligase D n=1 Tax=Chitinolyticbacter meiyuanensis TaxID=682798 RepID=UPI0011E59C1D|nr:DNA ligase D [Chitinolyticbacter meiyuanensis]
MSLDKYWQKRDFSKTPEPRGKVARDADELAFYIQKHAAKRLHYDFRLQIAGTLKSWAVPKGPSLDPHEKRLAVEVEDHPLDYGEFEGTIPERQYGAGSVLLWDRGRWAPEGDPAEGYRQGRLRFALHGEKLHGQWSLVRMARRDDDRHDNWLLIKSDDDEARAGPEAEITELRPESVKTAAPTAARRKSTRSADKLPPLLQPQLATLIGKAPSHGHWLVEVKYDGYRILARVDDAGAVHLYSRNGNDWTSRMQPVANAVTGLDLRNSWLDGEVVALDVHGHISFQALQNAFSAGEPARLVYFVFDLPFAHGEDLRQLPQRERKARLAALLEDVDDAAVRYSDHLDGNVKEAFAHACRHGLEGIIVKQADAAYASARSRNWLKVKCSQRQEFVIGGYTEPSGQRTGLGALLLGVHDEAGKLVYAGRVGTGFSDATLALLQRKLVALRRETTPFAEPPHGHRAAGVHWVKPQLVAEVRFADWTEQGLLRQAAFLGLREDKPATAIVRESPDDHAAADREPPPAGKSGRTVEARSKGPAQRDATVAGVVITHPSRIVFADSSMTKLDLATYYAAVAEHMLPHLAGRPLSLVRCPSGSRQPCFFQKHLGDSLPATIDRITVPEGDGTAEYVTVDNVAALVALVQYGVQEFHTWGARGDKPMQPDRLIFDLDPAPDVAWTRVREAALLVRGVLEELGLAAFLKTTGGKGLHVEAPLIRGVEWDEAKAFARSVAEHLAATLPDRFTTKLAKQQRGGKIFIDYLRNGLGATAVAAFSTRARPGAPVATPITWAELEAGVESASFTVENIGERLAQLKSDPWDGYAAARRRLTQAMIGTLADAARRRTRGRA